MTITKLADFANGVVDFANSALGIGQGGGPSKPRNREPWTETSGSNIKGVDHRLTDILSRAAVELSARHPGYTVEGFSGKKGRSSGTPNHPAGRAIDVNIIGPDGKALKNEKDGRSFPAYHELAQIARSIQSKDYPELDGRMAWGGNFRQGVSFDQMHFDLGGTRGAYGTIEGGLNKAGREAMARLGFPDVADTYAWDSTGLPAGPRMADTTGMPGITDMPMPTARPDVSETAIPVERIASAPLAPVASSAQPVTPSPSGAGTLVGGDFSDRLAPASSAYAELGPAAERAPAITALEHLVGRDVTPPSAPSSFLGRPAQIASNTQSAAPASSFIGHPSMVASNTAAPAQKSAWDRVTSREFWSPEITGAGVPYDTGMPVATAAERQKFDQPAAPRPETARPAVSATSTPAKMSPAEFSGFIGLQPDRVGPVAPKEKVSPIGYELQAPERVTEHVNPIGYEVQSPIATTERVSPSVTPEERVTGVTPAPAPDVPTSLPPDRPAPVDPNYTPPAAVQPAPTSLTDLPKIGTPQEPTPEQLAAVAPQLAAPAAVKTRKVTPVATFVPPPKSLARPVAKPVQPEQPKKTGFLGSIFNALSADAPNPPSYDFGSGAAAIDSVLGGGGLAGAVARSNSNPNVSYKDLGNGVIAKVNNDPRFARPTIEYTHTGLKGPTKGRGFFSSLFGGWGGGGASSGGYSGGSISSSGGGFGIGGAGSTHSR
jgi:hypothetical protein